MNPSAGLSALLRRVASIGLVAAALGTVVVAFGYTRFRQQFYPAYLTAFMYWLSLSLGCLGIAMVHGLTGGRWGKTIRRILEAGYETMPLMALLFVPIWLNVSQIYEWSDPEFVHHHETVAKKAGYLNVAGFQGRSIAYFVIWVVITWVLNGSSPNEDDDDSPRGLRLQQVSGLGFMAYGFTLTLAAVDWLMSLEPEWYSTMYGLVQIAGQGMAGLCFGVVVAASLRKFEPWSRSITERRFNDLGNLILASVMFWTYCSFFQYLVIWSGNLPEENSWYVHRSQLGWQYPPVALFLLHFAIPFLMLLSRPLKRDSRRLCGVAVLLLIMHYVDLYWIIVPGFQRADATNHGLTFHWLNLAALVMIGGLWLSVFAWRLSIRIKLPIFDPELTEKANGRKLQPATT